MTSRSRPTPIPVAGLALALAGCAPAAASLDCDADVDVLEGADREALFAVPDGTPRGLAVFFHGLGEGACNWADRVEEDRVADAALERGLAWVAPDGADAAWNVDSGPDEVAPVDALIARLEDDGVLPAGLPTLALGHSNGGAFAQVYAVDGARDVVAAVNANGWGTAALGPDATPPPMLFVTAENDTVVSATTVLDAATAAADRGHDVRVELHVRTRLELDRFTRIPGIDEDGAAELIAAFEGALLLDGSGRPATNPRTDTRYAAAIPASMDELASDINEQLHVAFAEHRFSSADIDAVFGLFDEATGAE